MDRDGQPIDHEYWRDEALRTLGGLFGGATAFPQGRGVWRDDERGGALVFDESSVVCCWAAVESLTEDTLAALRRFLHRMGRETRQGAIGIMVDNRYHAITEFDQEATA